MSKEELRIEAVLLYASLVRLDDPTTKDLSPADTLDRVLQRATPINVIAKKFVLSQDLDKEDLFYLRRALNRRVKIVAYMMMGAGKVPYVMLSTHPERVAAERLTRFWEYLARPIRLELNPIGVCAECEVVFFKGRADKRYCSGKCGNAARFKETMKKDPDYYARKARENRQAKKDRLDRKKKKARAKRRESASR